VFLLARCSVGHRLRGQLPLRQRRDCRAQEFIQRERNHGGSL